MRKLSPYVVLFISVFTICEAAFSWGKHHLVTRYALLGIQDFESVEVRYRPLAELIEDMGLENARALNEEIEIHKDYEFKQALRETPDQMVSAIEILSKYSDEPDWGLDTDLFADDQYPELWRPEYSGIGGRTGNGSKGHRHLYWRAWDPKNAPLSSLHIQSRNQELGISPERAEIFIQLSRRAKELGHNYWALRFLANGLHYIEDISSPFHSTQIPTLLFVLKTLMSEGGSFMEKGTKVVSYYHYAFEDTIAWLLSDLRGRPLRRALRALPEEQSIDITYDGQPGNYIRSFHLISEARSSRSAKAAYFFFPSPPRDLSNFEPHDALTEAWWVEIRGRTQSEDNGNFLTFFNESIYTFGLLGESIRDIVKYEMGLNKP